MTTELQTLVLSDRHTVMSALTIFQQHQIRHLPILNDRQQLIGIVTPEHIRQILQPVNLLKFRSVAEGMTSEVVHAVPTTTILQIAQSNLLQLLDPLEMLYMLEQLQQQTNDRSAELEQSNRELRLEVIRRQQIEDGLELRVQKRTVELNLRSQQLQDEIANHEFQKYAIDRRSWLQQIYMARLFLNNVLTPIVGAAQLLPMTLPNLDDRNRRLLNMLVESSKRGSGLVKQILTFARGLDGERTTIQSQHILAEIISVARQTFPRSIVILTGSANEIQVNNASEDLWLVNVDATQIHQVLMNLFVNARDAMPTGGSLTASSENMVIDADFAQIQLPAGAYILIKIADTGTGMTSETLEREARHQGGRIFDPFFTTKETGTGLGLSTVQGIVTAHGGAIEVESQIGRGTCFKIYLPALYSKEAESSAAAADLDDGKGLLVLVVDDEVTIREIAKESLETYNYRVMLASDGIEAIDLYAKNHRSIAIVLIDMMMPNLDTRLVWVDGS